MLRDLPDRYDRSAVQSALAMALRLKVIVDNTIIADTKENIDENQLFNDLSSDLLQRSDNATVSNSLRQLVSRMKVIESTIVESSADKAVSDRNLFLLRDLRKRVLDLENSLSDQLIAERREWALERDNLIQIANDNMDIVMQFRQEQDDSVSIIKDRYEEALRKSNEALELHTNAAKSEIERLEEIIRQYAMQVSQLRSKPTETHNSTIDSVNRKESSSESSVSPVNNNLEEFLKMQRLLDQTNDDLIRSRQQLSVIEEAHRREVADLKNQFHKYQLIQNEVISSLENQSIGNPEDFSSDLFPLLNLADAEDKLRVLGYKYKSKSIELEAALR